MFQNDFKTSKSDLSFIFNHSANVIYNVYINLMLVVKANIA